MVLSGMCGHKNKKCFQQHKSESTSMFFPVQWEEFRELKNYKHTFCEPSVSDNIRIYSLAWNALGFRQDSGQEQHSPSGVEGWDSPKTSVCHCLVVQMQKELRFPKQSLAVDSRMVCRISKKINSAYLPSNLLCCKVLVAQCPRTHL